MQAGPKYQYLWADGELVKKPLKCSAPEYVSYLMEWIQRKFDDQTIFPLRVDEKFGPEFRNTVETIFKRLFRIYSHLYYHHFKQLETLKAADYLNLSFKHFVYFVEQHSLIDQAEMKPLALLIANMHEKEAAKKSVAISAPNIFPSSIATPKAPLASNPSPKASMTRLLNDSKTSTPAISPLNLHRALPLNSSSSLSRHSQNSSLSRSVEPTKEISLMEEMKIRAASPEFRKTMAPSPSKQMVESREHVAEMEQVNLPKTIFTPATPESTVQEPMVVAKNAHQSVMSSGAFSSTAGFSVRSFKDSTGSVSNDDEYSMHGDRSHKDSVSSSVANKMPGSRPLSKLDLISEENNPVIEKRIESLPKNIAAGRQSIYDGFAFEKFDNGVWTMSTFGDVMDAEVRESLEHFSPKVALIGISWESSIILKVLNASGYTVSALCSHEEGANKWGKDNNIACVTYELSDIYDMEDVGIYIFAPPSNTRDRENMLTDLISFAYAHNKIVCCAPQSLPLPHRRQILLTLTGKESQRMAQPMEDPARKHLVMAIHPLRTLPVMTRVRDAITIENAVGQILTLNLNLECNWKHHLKSMVATGDKTMDSTQIHTLSKEMMSSMISHFIDLSTWLVGGAPIISVTSQFRKLQDENGVLEPSTASPCEDIDADYALIHFETSEGVTIVLNMYFVSPFAESTLKLLISGRAGKIETNENTVRVRFATDKEFRLLMEDQSAESTFELPFQLLSTGMLHYLRSLKLSLFQLALTPNQELLVSQFTDNVASLENGYRNTRICEAIRRQRMYDLSAQKVVTELLKISPRAIQAFNDERDSAKELSTSSKESSRSPSMDPIIKPTDVTENEDVPAVIPEEITREDEPPMVPPKPMPRKKVNPSVNPVIGSTPESLAEKPLPLPRTLPKTMHPETPKFLQVAVAAKNEEVRKVAGVQEQDVLGSTVNFYQEQQLLC